MAKPQNPLYLRLDHRGQFKSSLVIVDRDIREPSGGKVPLRVYLSAKCEVLRQRSRFLFPTVLVAWLWKVLGENAVICLYMQEESADLHYSYNTTGYTDPYLKSLV